MNPSPRTHQPPCLDDTIPFLSTFVLREGWGLQGPWCGHDLFGLKALTGDLQSKSLCSRILLFLLASTWEGIVISYRRRGWDAMQAAAAEERKVFHSLHLPGSSQGLQDK